MEWEERERGEGLGFEHGGDGDALGRRRSRGGRRLGGADFVVVDFAVVLVEEGFEVGLWERRGREAGE